MPIFLRRNLFETEVDGFGKAGHGGNLAFGVHFVVGGFCLCLLCLSSILPGMDWELVLGWFLIFIVFAPLFGGCWVSWSMSKRLKFRNLFFGWLGLTFLGVILGSIAKYKSDDLAQVDAGSLRQAGGWIIFLSVFYLGAIIFRGCRLLWGKISKKSSDS